MKLDYQDYILAYETVQKEDKSRMKPMHLTAALVLGGVTLLIWMMASSEFPQSQKALKEFVIFYLVALVLNSFMAYIFFYRERNDIIIWKIPAQMVALISGGFSVLFFLRLVLDNYRNLFLEFLLVFIFISVTVTLILFWNMFRKYYSLKNFNKLNIITKIPLMVIFSYPIVILLRLITSKYWDQGFEYLVAVLVWGILLFSPTFIVIPSWMLFARMDKKTIQAARDKKERLYGSLENAHIEEQS